VTFPAFDHPAILFLLPACLPPLLGAGARRLGFASLIATPADPASRLLDGILRALAALPLAGIIIGLAGPHVGPASVERTGLGAHVVVVLDRSLSMDEPFALRGEKASETKTEAATREIADFFARRPHDEFALVAFSTAPIVAMPLTPHRAAAAAAIAAMRGKALANTDIGAGLAMGLLQFADDSAAATRVLLFVSDGAGAIRDRTRTLIRDQAQALGVHLYYLYLRAGDDPPLAGQTDGDLDRPAGLDGFFRSLGVPYLGFEARDSGAIQAAVRRLESLETRPITYRETLPRRDLDAACYGAAAVCLVLTLLAQLAERGLAGAAGPVRK
jgi:mxaC protein